jgi:multidrug efflux pump subunit AcrA (membrane-fusion protein)
MILQAGLAPSNSCSALQLMVSLLLLLLLLLLQAPQDGEVVQFRAEEGDPVEYGQVVVAIAPFFAVAEAGVTEYR